MSARPLATTTPARPGVARAVRRRVAPWARGHRRAAGARRLLSLLAVVALALGLAGCGGDGDPRGAAPATSATEPAAGSIDVATLSGGAPAARGAGLAEPPGPSDRVALDSFDVRGLGFGEVAIALTAPDGEVVGWCVLLAATSEQRQRGLMEVTDLGGYAGMLFVWDADNASAFYMRNTPTPLSIGWFEADGDLVSTADMDPCADVDACPTYGPPGRYRFALELPQARAGDGHMGAGSKLAVGGACATRA